MDLLGRVVRRPIATCLIALLLLLLGVATAWRMPLSTLPVIEVPTLGVFASLPGASADTMASSVTSPLERELSKVAGVAEMKSTSSTGSTSIYLQFDVGRDFNDARRDIEAAVDDALSDLPPDMPRRPDIVQAQPPDGQMISIAVSSTLLPLTEVDMHARVTVAQRLSHISGVGGLDIHGAQPSAVHVALDPFKLAARDVSAEDVHAALVAATSPTPSGRLSGGNAILDFDVAASVRKVADFEALRVKAGVDTPVRLGEVATVSQAALEEDDRAWAQGRRAVVLDVYRQRGAKVLDVIAEIRRQLPEIRRDLPPAIDIDIVGDRSQSVLENIHEAGLTLVITVLVVVLVVGAFLRGLRLALIPVVAIPLSLAGAAVLGWMAGYGINTLTLIAIIVAVGFVIDDAIVVFENIVRHMETGTTVVQAALRGTREVVFTVISMTLSLVVALVPLLFMDGLVGRMFREFAFTIGASLLTSALVSLTVTPAMCRYLLASGAPGHGAKTRPSASARGWFDRLGEQYGHALNWSLRHRGAVAVATVLMLPLTAAVFLAIPKGFFPEQDTGLVVCSVRASVDVTPEAMANRVEDIMERLRTDSAVATVHGWVDASSSNTATMIVGLRPYSERHEGVKLVIKRLIDVVGKPPGFEVYLRPRQDLRSPGRPGRTNVTYSLQSPDSGQLYESLPRVVDALKKLPALKSVVAELPEQRSKATLIVDSDRANALGVSRQAIDESLRDTLGRRQVATLLHGPEPMSVVLGLAAAFRADTDSLTAVPVSSAGGTLVPLGAVSTIQHMRAPTAIEHRDQLPAVDIAITPAPGVSLGEAVEAIEAAVSKLDLPSGVRGAFQGNTKAFQTAIGSQPWLIFSAIAIIYIVLGVLYESFIHPITILSTLPSAGLGALLSIWAFERELNLISMVGLILLVGIVKKNAIMMVDVALTLRRSHNLSTIDATVQACITRFRPIMMTTLAALLGSVPLLLGSGPGSELRAPIGVAMIGGLVVSQLVTLFTTPGIFIYLENLTARLSRRDGDREQLRTSS